MNLIFTKTISNGKWEFFKQIYMECKLQEITTKPHIAITFTCNTIIDACATNFVSQIIIVSSHHLRTKDQKVMFFASPNISKYIIHCMLHVCMCFFWSHTSSPSLGTFIISCENLLYVCNLYYKYQFPTTQFFPTYILQMSALYRSHFISIFYLYNMLHWGQYEDNIGPTIICCPIQK